MKQRTLLFALCGYAFFKGFKPTEPFLTPYLTTDKNFTNSQLSQQVYPVWTYSYLLVLIPVFLLTDLLRYKIVILAESLFYVITWLLLIWGTTIPVMQLMQFFYGCGTSMEVAYYAYIYVAMDRENYKKTTSMVKSSSLIGKFLAYSGSQVAVSLFGAPYTVLNYVTLINMSLIFVIAITLPSVSWREDKNLHLLMQPLENKSSSEILYKDYVRMYFETFFTKFKQNYSVALVWKWSLWWSLATCGFLQVGNYVQNLWLLNQADQSDVYNGIVQGVNTLLGAIIVFLMQFVKLKFEVWGELIMAVTSAAECSLLVVMSLTNILPLSYTCYCICRVLYQIMIVIAMFNLGKIIKTESYGLVFGFNTFMALVLQTLLTMTIVDKGGLALNITTQFLVYAGYHGLIAILFFIIGLYTICRKTNERQPVIV